MTRPSDFRVNLQDLADVAATFDAMSMEVDQPNAHDLADAKDYRPLEYGAPFLFSTEFVQNSVIRAAKSVEVTMGRLGPHFEILRDFVNDVRKQVEQLDRDSAEQISRTLSQLNASIPCPGSTEVFIPFLVPQFLALRDALQREMANIPHLASLAAVFADVAPKVQKFETASQLQIAVARAAWDSIAGRTFAETLAVDVVQLSAFNASLAPAAQALNRVIVAIENAHDAAERLAPQAALAFTPWLSDLTDNQLIAAMNLYRQPLVEAYEALQQTVRNIPVW